MLGVQLNLRKGILPSGKVIWSPALHALAGLINMTNSLFTVLSNNVNYFVIHVYT